MKKGDELGKMTVSLGDTDYGTVKLVAANDVSQSTWLARKAALSNLFSKVWVRILLIVLVVWRHRRGHPRPYGRPPPQSLRRHQTPQRPRRRIPWWSWPGSGCGGDGNVTMEKQTPVTAVTGVFYNFVRPHLTKWPPSKGRTGAAGCDADRENTSCLTTRQPVFRAQDTA